MHYWYFTDRIQKVTEGNNFDGKVILDIGAGTGALYDFINSRSSNFEYYGNDIASEMLAHSNIPVSNRRIGVSYECCSDLHNLDFVFMLGVTTYMSNPEIEKTLQFIFDRLKKDGKLYVTFTNSASYNVKLIKRIKPLLRRFGKNRVAGQSFQIQEFTVAKAKELIPAGLQVSRVDYLNQSFFPIAHLFGGFSAKLGKFLQKKVRNDKMLQRLSSEFIFEIKTSGL
jgi:SAM-dependent methyltransferase